MQKNGGNDEKRQKVNLYDSLAMFVVMWRKFSWVTYRLPNLTFPPPQPAPIGAV